jgi:hypothetical protein
VLQSRIILIRLRGANFDAAPALSQLYGTGIPSQRFFKQTKDNARVGAIFSFFFSDFSLFRLL